MRKFATLLVILLTSMKGFSTHQVEDYLIFNSDTLFFYASPLEQIDSISSKIQKINKSKYLSTGCWRGFYAEWILIGNSLYLSKVFDCENDKLINVTIEKILGYKFKNGLLKANWVNGFLWCGFDLVSEKSLYLSVYRHEYKLHIQKGELVYKEEFNFVPCAYSTQGKIIEFIIKNLNWKLLPSINDENLEFEFELELNRAGNIKNVKLIRSNNLAFNNEIARVINQLPCWTVYFREGSLYNYKDWLTVIIENNILKQHFH